MPHDTRTTVAPRAGPPRSAGSGPGRRARQAKEGRLPAFGAPRIGGTSSGVRVYRPDNGALSPHPASLLAEEMLARPGRPNVEAAGRR
jgi:hypothetical protein